MPELDYFSTAQARQNALDEIGKEAGNPGSGGFWIGIVAVVAGALLARWLHRRGTARDLRLKLLAVGVPVCVQCGYLLRGLSPDIGRCPECGTQFSPQAADILRQNPAV